MISFLKDSINFFIIFFFSILSSLNASDDKFSTFIIHHLLS
nr:MAG TPA: hypothetical protein [Caudoviricetes sp.]